MGKGLEWGRNLIGTGPAGPLTGGRLALTGGAVFFLQERKTASRLSGSQ